MMKMYFHGGYHEVILFDFWRISSVGGLIGSMIGCFLLGVLYEGLKFFREFLLRQEYRYVDLLHQQCCYFCLKIFRIFQCEPFTRKYS